MEIYADVTTVAGLKTPRIRSVAYPSISLLAAFSLTERIYKTFGSATYIPRESICKQLGIPDGTIQTQLSSCVQYGLLEIKSKEGYRPTSLFIKIYKPKPNENKRDSEVDAFKTPDLYQKIIRKHTGEVLTIQGLATILYRDHKVGEAASTNAAKIFIENAKSLDLINEDGKLDIEEIVIPIDEFKSIEVQNSNAVEKPVEVSYLTPPDVRNQKKFNAPPIPIFLEQGVAELYLPNGFNKQDIERIIKILRAYVE